MGSMRNGLCEFELGREWSADRGLTRCSLKVQQKYQKICQLYVVSCQLRDGGRRPSVARTAATGRVPETRAGRGVVSCRGRATEARARRFSSVEGVSQGVVRLRESVSREISRRDGNGSAHAKSQGRKKSKQRIQRRFCESQRPGHGGRERSGPRSRVGLVSASGSRERGRSCRVRNGSIKKS